MWIHEFYAQIPDCPGICHYQLGTTGQRMRRQGMCVYAHPFCFPATRTVLVEMYTLLFLFQKADKTGGWEEADIRKTDMIRKKLYD